MTHYKRLTLFLLINLLFMGWATAQESSAPDLVEINRERVGLNTGGMAVLGGWAVSNLLIGTVGMTRTGGSVRYFHQMNAAWNTVNLAIAGFGYYGLKNQSLDLTLAETISEYHTFEKILLFNAGLDVGYMALGAFLWERGLRKESERLTGYGQSLILQGGFLFSFDVVLYLLNRTQSEKLIGILDNIHFSGTAMTVQIPF
ncbi:DUF6992 family protein [Rhodohalobacter mucosus]|uniref:Uncharacterized protein n=1 Tax=Rhodohalobacter mucosus TaxID=2079485 RepID=A0A316TT51_9BACT|nr:hypothetical protein [Rhodohalobacter mucosus]PWN05422.1 hypothetical protein DDZ15_15260 [Rhodohalobacter mucosus]